jgi:hypothetical protein
MMFRSIDEKDASAKASDPLAARAPQIAHC